MCDSGSLLKPDFLTCETWIISYFGAAGETKVVGRYLLNGGTAETPDGSYARGHLRPGLSQVKCLIISPPGL